MKYLFGVMKNLSTIVPSLVSFFSWTLRRLRAKDASKFHVQLCLSLGAMLIVFVAGIDRTENRAGCITVGVLIHYFTLVAWMWMGAEALLMFRKLVLVFGEMSLRFLLLVSLVCWSKRTCTHTHTNTHTRTSIYSKCGISKWNIHYCITQCRYLYSTLV